MIRLHQLTAIMAAFWLVWIIAGCSGASSPTLPSSDSGQNPGNNPAPSSNLHNPANPLDITVQSAEEEDEEAYNRVLWGAWNITFNPDTLDVEIVPNRQLELHYNVTPMVTPPKCTTCLGIKVLSVDPVTYVYAIRVSLRNPTPAITGYDVRGTLLFPTGDNRELVNRDGFTKIFANPRGPFKAFAVDKPQRRFLPGVTEYAQYNILFPPPANLTVSYVIDASWPANQEEVYQITDMNMTGGLNECNSKEGWLYATLNDWQSNPIGITVDLTPLGGGVVPMEKVINQTYRTFINNFEWKAPAGSYKLWFTATSANTTNALYDFYMLNVAPCTNTPPVWVDTIGVVQVKGVTGGLQVTYGTALDVDIPVTYNVYWSENKPIEWTTAGYINDTDGSPTILNGLSDASTYYVGVRAIDKLGNEEKNTIQLTGKPSNPPQWITTIGITAAIAKDKSVEVQYGTATDPQTPVTYNVYYSETTPVNFATAPSITDTGSPTIVPGLNNFKTYYFAVRAEDAFGSEDQNTKELPATPNGAPEWVDTVGIQSTIPGDKTVTVTYGTATDIDLPISYRVYYSQTTPINFATAPYKTDTDGSPYTVTGLTNDQPYYFAVRAVDAGGLAETNTVQLPGTPNAAPTWINGKIGVQSLVPFDHQVTVSYGEATDPDLPITYYIFYSKTTPINFATAPYKTTTSLSPYIVTGLDNYVPYYFAVRAQDSKGIRDANTVVLSTIPNPAPIWDTTTGITSVEVGNQKVTVYYGTATDIDIPMIYRVYYSTTSPINFATAPYINDPTGSPTIVSPLNNGQPYFFAVRAVDAYGHEDQNTVTLSATPQGLPIEVWKVFTGGVVQSSPALVDLNGDSVLDVVVGDQANKMVAYNGINGSVIWTFPTGGWVDSSPALADMNDDSVPDAVFGCLDKKVYCVNGATGTQLWAVTTGSGVISSPVLANIKGDFHRDVIVGSMDGKLYAYNGVNGAQLWNFPTGAGIFSSPASVDLTGDSIPDFVVGSRDGNVYAVNGNSGLQIWSFAIGEWVNSSPALANLNGDSTRDVVIAGLDGDVYAINGLNGAQLWSFPTGSYIWTSPAIGMINGDGVPDVVIGADSSNVYAINGQTGAQIWSFPSKDRIWSSAALADLNGDNIPEAIVGSDDGFLYAINGVNGALWFSYSTSDWIDSSPAVADINSNGKLDIAFGGFDGYVYVITSEVAGVGITPWPMFRRDIYHSAAY